MAEEVMGSGDTEASEGLGAQERVGEIQKNAERHGGAERVIEGHERIFQSRSQASP